MNGPTYSHCSLSSPALWRQGAQRQAVYSGTQSATALGSSLSFPEVFPCSLIVWDEVLLGIWPSHCQGCAAHTIWVESYLSKNYINRAVLGLSRETGPTC